MGLTYINYIMNDLPTKKTYVYSRIDVFLLPDGDVGRAGRSRGPEYILFRNYLDLWDICYGCRHDRRKSEGTD